jgi:phospholipase/carboxylesterase
MVCLALGIGATAAMSQDLPSRLSPIPKTTRTVPHVQIGVRPNHTLSNRLLEQVENISGITIRPTVVSLPGALGFWIDEAIPLAHPETIVAGREFAHVHPDGSLHASLPPALAQKAIKSGWAIAHPWATQRAGWEGFVMIYSPSTTEEADVVFDLVKQAFEYVTA